MGIDVQVDLYLMANLSPLFTGLPFVVWISVRGGAKHDIRVKVSKGPKAQSFITVALRPELRVVGDGKLSTKEMNMLKRWVARNWDVLLAYWNVEIYTEQAMLSLQKI